MTRPEIKTLAVVGIGRVGLPLAISFAEAGLRVLGVDRDPAHVERVNAGILPFIEHGAEEPLKRVIDNGNLRATVDGPSAISQADAVIVTVGTPLGSDFRVDRTQVEAALSSWGGSLKPGALVVMRSTLSPGTTENLVVPTLERATGRKLGDGLFVAFCPERIAEGKAMEELKTLPEIIGGVDDASSERAADLFRRLAPDKEIRKTDSLSAELAKLYGNVYRYVTFALANEYALIAEHYGRDAHHIISTLRDGYSRAPVPLPGLAGGPCLSKDGYFLIEELTFPDFVLTAWKLNDSMAAHMVERLSRALEKQGKDLAGTKVAVLGQAFKADIDDDRLSPSLRVIEALERRQAEVRVHDPYLREETLDEVLRDAEAVVLATNHAQYGDIDPQYLADLVAEGCVVAECWAMFDPEAFAGQGIEVITLGRG
ncbi:MAG TPA: nucleotide sugar dehydrogenase [Acidimicrobiia bacterium]|nr:nucleotide sugar dehydrogenase [Acidimicrobiia bacterium]